MSKIGKQPILVPAEVTVEIKDSLVAISGPKGAVEKEFPSMVVVEFKEGQIKIGVKSKNKQALALWGTVRATLANMVAGVVRGWKKQLELVGAGFRAEVVGTTLSLLVGYSHPVKIEAPPEISFAVEKNIITVEGIDKELVGQVAANIRKIKPPEPYKGKGIKYVGEIVRRKPGKAAKTVGGPA